MNAQTSQDNNPRVLRLEGELSVFRAQELKQLLLSSPAPEIIDLSAVSELDTAGLQLLMLAKRAAQVAQREWRLVGHSQAVIEVFDLLNVAEYFDHRLVVTQRGKAGSEKSTHAAGGGR